MRQRWATAGGGNDGALVRAAQPPGCARHMHPMPPVYNHICHAFVIACAMLLGNHDGEDAVATPYLSPSKGIVVGQPPRCGLANNIALLITLYKLYYTFIYNQKVLENLSFCLAF